MLRSRRHFLTLALAAGLTLVAGGCRRAEPSELRVAVIGAGPLELGDPLAAPSNEAQAVLRATTAQGLIRFDAAGQIEPGLAERWNVSDDGLSYIFRLANGTWPDGRKYMARDVANMLKRQLRARGGDPTREALGAVDDVVAMTDRVIEIRLRAPRPNLLTLLAQPEFALFREGLGGGPFAPRKAKPGDDKEGFPAALRLRRQLPGLDGEPGEKEDVRLSVLAPAAAVAAFGNDRLDLVLGGSFADLPAARRARLRRGALRFDPAAGLFGLVPARADGLLANADVRALLNEAIDRAALVAALGVPGLAPRATLLQSGLEGLPDPVQPAWLGQPLAERLPALKSFAQAQFAVDKRPRLAVALPEGLGGDLLLARLRADWGAIGFDVDRAASPARADLILLDLVAPSNAPGWFVRMFRCGRAPICLPAADPLLQSAREAPVAAQRAALLGEIARMMDDATLFMPLTAPVRWSLVGDRAVGFQENRFARHPLGGIAQRTTARGYTP